MQKLLRPKNILITGASGGLGGALAEYYAQPGITLLLTGRDAARLATMVATCQKKGANVIFKATDITNPDFSKWIAEVIKSNDVDLVIANAGVSSSLGANGEPETLEMIEYTFAVNFHGVIHTITPFVSLMRERGRGQIAIISSFAAWRGLPHSPAYCASKAACKSYGESLRAWLARDGIGVSVIFPGFIKSAMTDKLAGPKPLMVSAEHAAKIIVKGLERNKAEISFPPLLTMGYKLFNMLPNDVTNPILRRLKAYVQ